MFLKKYPSKENLILEFTRLQRRFNKTSIFQMKGNLFHCPSLSTIDLHLHFYIKSTAQKKQKKSMTNASTAMIFNLNQDIVHIPRRIQKPMLPIRQRWPGDQSCLHIVNLLYHINHAHPNKHKVTVDAKEKYVSPFLFVIITS